MKGTNFENAFDVQIQSKQIFEGRVVDVVNFLNGTLRVRIDELDKDLLDSELPLCVPMNPYTFLKITPKKGERVILQFQVNYDTNNAINKSQRYWTTIVHSSPIYNNFQDFYNSSSNYNGGYFKDDVDFFTKKYDGLFPSSDDVCLYGRENSQIRLGNNKIEILCGLHERGNPQKINTSTPIKLTLDFKSESTLTASANKIVLGSNLNNDKLSKKTESQELVNIGKPIPYGDKLIELLNLVRLVILNHVHPYNGMKIDIDDLVQKLAQYDLSSINNKNVLTI